MVSQTDTNQGLGSVLRYPRLTEELCESLKLWPAYMHWARGCLKLAADDFAAAVELLENRMCMDTPHN